MDIHDKRIEIAKQVFEAWSSGDADAPEPFFTPEATLFDVASGQFDGWPAIRTFFAAGLAKWDDLVLAPDEFWVNDDGLALHYLMSATVKDAAIYGPDVVGRKWEVHVMSFLRFDGDRVCYEADFHDKGSRAGSWASAEVGAEPFTIAIPEEALDDLRERLRRTRWAEDYANDDWRYGANGSWLRSMVDYWIDGYDWRVHEAAMNAFPQFRVELDDIPIHFIHVKGKGPNPTPLILTHGWPWTFWDFHAVIGPLSDPGAYGGDPADAFDVVVPSLPGFGFSSPLRVPGVNAPQTADLWVRLIRDVLGYDRFAAQGGDWGAIVTSYMGHRYAEHLIGIHLSFPALLGAGFRTVKPEDYGPGEEEWYDRMVSRMQTAASHVAVHTADPQTLAYALNDSPVGLAAWLLERRRNWSDSGGDPERPFTRDFLLTTVMIYWLTQTIGTSMRYYAEFFGRPFVPDHDRQPAIEPPTGVAVFPQELVILPRSLVERHTNLVQWTLMPAGGHFAAAEQPDLLVADVQSLFRTLRGA